MTAGVGFNYIVLVPGDSVSVDSSDLSLLIVNLEVYRYIYILLLSTRVLPRYIEQLAAVSSMPCM